MFLIPDKTVAKSTLYCASLLVKFNSIIPFWNIASTVRFKTDNNSEYAYTNLIVPSGLISSSIDFKYSLKEHSYLEFDSFIIVFHNSFSSK